MHQNLEKFTEEEKRHPTKLCNKHNTKYLCFKKFT